MTEPSRLAGPDAGDLRAAALVRLFETLRHGLYTGRVGRPGSATTAANSALKLILGLAPETPDAAVRPFDPDRFVDPELREVWLDRLARDGGVTDYVLRLRRGDGTPIWVEVTGHADPLDPGWYDLQVLVRDVSERRRLDDQARDLSHQFLQAEKLAALGQMISGVAHELNNPLATILTCAERLRQHPVDAGLRRGVDTIVSESERAAKIVRNLLTFARKRHTTRSMVDLTQVARETIALRQYEQRLGNVVVIDALASGLPGVFGDPHQLQQVFLNLVINAEQAMLAAHGRGTLIMRSWQAADRETVTVELSDDGPGVPAEVMPKVFDPFFTTKAAGQGTGLGLTVAYAIVQEHGGRLVLSPGAAGGATFAVELPIAGATASLPAAASPVAANVGGGAAVLVVEDEEALALAVAESLADAGFKPETARDGEDALARVLEQTFDLVICDLRMPRLNGPSFYRALATRSPALARRVIFVTGDVAGTDAERFLEESGCRWLPKPFRLAELLRLARETLG
jgi:signal transduction histidine kinase/CheY-like chemotaxis protein